MLVENAYVSGSLGWALFRMGGRLTLLDAPDAEPREPRSNEVFWFRKVAQHVATADPDGLPVHEEVLRRRLSEEIAFFKTLDGLLTGMDPDFPDELRKASIKKAEEGLARCDCAFRHRIDTTFLVPIDDQWDPATAVTLAREVGARLCADRYRAIAEGVVTRFASDLDKEVQAQWGTGLAAAKARDNCIQSGMLAARVAHWVENQGGVGHQTSNLSAYRIIFNQKISNYVTIEFITIKFIV